MIYARIENGIIVSRHAGKKPEGDNYQEIPEGCLVMIGDARARFDANWNPRPLVELIKENLEQLPPGYKLESGEIVKKSLKEALADGDVELPENHVADGETIRPMNQDELYSAGKITREAWLESTIRPQRDALLASSDWTQAVGDSPLTAEKKAAWKDYRKQLRDITKTAEPGKPWPEKP